MTSTITTHKFAQMQHAEYEAQLPRHTDAVASKEDKSGLIIGKIATLIHQVRVSISNPGAEEVSVSL